jgi:DNA-binding transcriptional LysR family regulator
LISGNWFLLPKLRYTFFHNTSQGFFDDLLQDKIDCAFALLPPAHPELVSVKLSTLEVGIVLPPGHRLAQQKEIPMEALRDESWIFAPREANPVLYDQIIRRKKPSVLEAGVGESLCLSSTDKFGTRSTSDVIRKLGIFRLQLVAIPHFEILKLKARGKGVAKE